MAEKKHFYITTAIDYPNGAPHMGHAYEKVVSDAYARWYRLAGLDTFFLTGTDENGQNLVKVSEGKTGGTKSFIDEQVVLFRNLCRDLRISFDDFIRTTEERHIKVSQEIWAKLEKKGDIYFGEYEGNYCSPCESFYTDLQAPDKKCPVHGKSLIILKEKGFFFKLGAYADWVKKYISDHPKIISPDSARNEMLKRIDKEPIRDLSVSRPNTGWGIPVPGNSDYVMYTWFDALINYLTAVHLDKDRFKRFWPPSMHVIGKDITWFHTVIWLSMLKAADLALPEQVYVHGMVLGEDGKRMSKTLGNGVDPQDVIQKFPVDSVRYYLLRAIPSGLDGAFVCADLIARHNSELANDYGNLLFRVAKLSLRKLGPELTGENVKSHLEYQKLGKQMHDWMEAREHHRAIETLWSGINEVNLYINNSAPWKLADGDPKFREVMYNSLYGIHCFATLMEPFMPEISKKTFEYLGTKPEGFKGLEFGKQKFHLTSPDSLFPKIEA